MTKNTVIFIFLNMIYLLIWYATNKIRSTKVGKELDNGFEFYNSLNTSCLLYTSPSPRDPKTSRMPSSA